MDPREPDDNADVPSKRRVRIKVRPGTYQVMDGGIDHNEPAGRKRQMKVTVTDLQTWKKWHVERSAAIGAHEAAHAVAATARTRRIPNFPRAWRLFSFLLDRGTRRTIFAPAYHDLRQMYFLAQEECTTDWSRHWVTFCFVIRTLVTGWQCLTAMTKGKLGDCAAWLIGAVIKSVLGIGQ